MKQTPNILVAPLDWGIGHATRCIPIIEALLLKGANVILASDGRALELLKREFPQLTHIRLRGYEVSYPKTAAMTPKLMRLAPYILKAIKKEHQELKEIIQKYNIHAVISDNRYGLWNRSVPCIFITHQLMIKMPKPIKYMELPFRQLVKKFVAKYDECWIPDFAGKKVNLSGDLSHKYKIPKNAYFIGPLSGMYSDEDVIDQDTEYQLFVLLSGPEPQRSLLEEKILSQLRNSNLKAIVVCGRPESNEHYLLTPDIEVFSYLPSKKIKELIAKSNLILSRPGYSTVMDLAACGKPAIFIPTPGQTEQKYLASYYLKNRIFFSMRQKDFDLIQAIEQSQQFEGVLLRYNPSLLHERIEYVLELIENNMNFTA